MPPATPPLSPGARELLDGSTGTGYQVADPATDGVLAELRCDDAAGVATAIRAARRAHDRTWFRMPGAERGRHLLMLSRTLAGHADEVAELQSRDTGTPFRQACERDLPEAVEHLRHHAGWADKLAHAGAGTGPIGVTAHLVPAASEVATALRTVAPALAAGNVAVLLAAEHSPLASVGLAELVLRAGLPEGVLTVLVGAHELRDTVLDSGVASVTVTGSAAEVAVARRRLVGGETRLRAHVTTPATTIVFADGDTDTALDDVVARTVADHHRRLGAGSRLLVQERVGLAVVEQLQKRMAALVVGPPYAVATDVGPLSAPAERDRAARAVEAAVRGGARRWVVPRIPPPDGAYLAPATLEDLPTPVRGQEEIAGPVVAVHVFTDVEEAVALSSSGPTVWTSSRSAVRALDRRCGAVTWADPDRPAARAFVPDAIGGYLDDA